MNDTTLNYVGADRHEPIDVQKRLAGPLRFWAMMLLALGLVMGVLATTAYVLDWTRTRVYAADGTWDVYWSWKVIWWRVPVSLPVVMGPWAWGWAYLVLAARLSRRAEDRVGMVAALVLTTLHAMGAALCVVLFVFLGGVAIQFSRLTLQGALLMVASATVLVMVPGMIYTSVRIMDALRVRVVRRVKVAGPPEVERHDALQDGGEQV